VGAAAQVYYGKSLDQLDLPQLAMIAGLPKAPSRFNPVANPDRALTRRNYVLGRMRDLDFITPAEYETAVRAPVSAMVHGLRADLEAPYVAEMARVYMEEKLGEEAYTGGYRLYTTLEPRFQMAASEALRQALLAYDRRHGFRGPELKLDPELELEAVEKAIADIPAVGGLEPAAVLSVEEQSISALVKDTGEIEIPWSGLQWARRHLNENRLGPELTQAGEILSKGDVIRVELKADGWTLAQIPKLEGAIVALDPNDGAVLALSGGFDFNRSKFNRVIQAERQPGSAFKPFVYSAAMENGFTPASMINDAPVVFDDPGIEAAWRPENYSGRFFGPTRIREALYKSRNLVSIRLVRAMGVADTLGYLERFGFDPARLPRDLSIALGSVTLTPLELARGFSVLANGGYLVEPYFVLQTQDSDAEIIEQAAPRRVCRECDSTDQQVEQNESAEAPIEASVTQPMAPDSAIEAAASEAESVELEEPEPEPAPRVISARNAWIMNSMMRDVIRRGTGRRALVLGRKDLAGKTGTTNDQRDAWFSGFNPNIVTTTWVGFDQLEPLGRGETGARAALPMWIDFMREALADVPQTILEQPQGLVTVRIDPDTGRLASAGDNDAIFETFYSERAPESLAEAATPASGGSSGQSGGVTEQLF
jgi:penicillin-binding protein 1A